MRFEPLGAGQRRDRLRDPAEAVLRYALYRDQFDEISGVESAAVSRGTRGRQHVIGPNRVVAGDLGRPLSDEHRAGVHNSFRDRLRARDHVF